MKKLLMTLISTASLITTYAQVTEPRTLTVDASALENVLRMNFGSITSPESKVGDRATYAKFQLNDPVSRTVVAAQYKSKTAATVFYSTDRNSLENFRAGIQGKELQNIITIRGIHSIRAAHTTNDNTSQSFRGIFPHENHQQFLNASGIFPRGTKIYFFWAFGTPYKHEDLQITEPDPTNYGDRDGFRLRKYFFHTITDKKVREFTMPRELTIAIAGESNSSGEGAPGTNPFWLNNNCHRSTNSGMLLGVEDFVRQHPELSIKYKKYFMGCSGASIPNLISSPQFGQFSQFQELANQRSLDGLTNHPIDVLLMSIGGNDISFSRLAGALFLPGVSLDNTYVRQLLGADLNEKFNSLNQRFSSLNDAIRLLRAKKVFLMSYPDLTHFNSSTYCGLPFTLDAVDIILNLAAEVPLALSDFVCPGDCFDTPVVDYFASRAVCLGKNLWSFLYELVDYIFNLTSVDDLQDVGATFADFFTEVGATRSEFRFAHENIIKRLNSTIQQNCSLYNWKFMANADQMTVNNGICNCNNTYFNTLGRSYIVQNDYKGTAHLNKNGHAAVNKTLVYNQLTNSILDSNSRKEIIVPTTQGNPSFDITANPQLKEKVNMLQLKDSETELKIREKVSGDRSRLLQRIQSLRPQLEKLKKHFKKRAEEVKP